MKLLVVVAVNCAIVLLQGKTLPIAGSCCCGGVAQGRERSDQYVSSGGPPCLLTDLPLSAVWTA